jgi:hypothetical protein
MPGGHAHEDDRTARLARRAERQRTLAPQRPPSHQPDHAHVDHPTSSPGGTNQTVLLLPSVESCLLGRRLPGVSWAPGVRAARYSL